MPKINNKLSNRTTITNITIPKEKRDNNLVSNGVVVHLKIKENLPKKKKIKKKKKKMKNGRQKIKS